jgi:3-phenylpropionate/cinnamic acid dioxygenase small subunit
MEGSMRPVHDAGRGELRMTDATTAPEVHVQVQRLVAQLALQADAGTLEDYLDLFTEDAVWEVPANDRAGVPAARCVGHDEIATSVRQRRALGVQGPGTGAMHHITTQEIEVHGEQATGRIYYQFVAIVDGVPTIRTLGQYRDRYRRTTNGWKLAHRVVLIA